MNEREETQYNLEEDGGQMLLKGLGTLLTHWAGKGNLRNYSARIEEPILITRKGSIINVTDADGNPLRDLDDITGEKRPVRDIIGREVQNPYTGLNLIVPFQMGVIKADNNPYEIDSMVIGLEGEESLVFAPYGIK